MTVVLCRPAGLVLVVVRVRRIERAGAGATVDRDGVGQTGKAQRITWIGQVDAAFVVSVEVSPPVVVVKFLGNRRLHPEAGIRSFQQVRHRAIGLGGLGAPFVPNTVWVSVPSGKRSRRC